jgi:hypothetical protein
MMESTVQNRPQFCARHALYYIRELGPPNQTHEMPSLKSEMQFSIAVRIATAVVPGDTRR